MNIITHRPKNRSSGSTRYPYRVIAFLHQLVSGSSPSTTETGLTSTNISNKHVAVASESYSDGLFQSFLLCIRSFSISLGCCILFPGRFLLLANHVSTCTSTLDWSNDEYHLWYERCGFRRMADEAKHVAQGAFYWTIVLLQRALLLYNVTLLTINYRMLW